jgi:hypothetical protein
MQHIRLTLDDGREIDLAELIVADEPTPGFVRVEMTDGRTLVIDGRDARILVGILDAATDARLGRGEDGPSD